MKGGPRRGVQLDTAPLNNLARRPRVKRRSKPSPNPTFQLTSSFRLFLHLHITLPLTRPGTAATSPIRVAPRPSPPSTASVARTALGEPRPRLLFLRLILPKRAGRGKLFLRRVTTVCRLKAVRLARARAKRASTRYGTATRASPSSPPSSSATSCDGVSSTTLTRTTAARF